jgi:putative PIN family toxin of toxin-antitoxin system
VKVVLDTNVLISGIFFKDTIPFQILMKWLEGRFLVYATPNILDEYLRVIAELESQREPALFYQWTDVLSEACHLIPDTDLKTISDLRDPSDAKFIFCAWNCGAQYLVTGDKDLTALGPQYGPTKIITPREFIKILD